MKKILFITNNWFYDYGGRRIASTRIIKNLVHRNCDITFVDFEVKTNQIPKYKIKNNINFDNRVHILTHFIKTNKALIPYLIDISKKSQFDLLICSGGPHFDIMAVFVIRLFNLFKKSKVVLLAHNHPLKSIRILSFSIKDSFYNFVYYISSYFIYGLFDKIITPGTSLKHFFVSHFYYKTRKNISY